MNWVIGEDMRLCVINKNLIRDKEGWKEKIQQAMWKCKIVCIKCKNICGIEAKIKNKT